MAFRVDQVTAAMVRSGRIDDFVPLAVAADSVIWREDLEKVLIESFSCEGRQPARARQAIQFLVDKAVIPPAVLGFESQLNMVDHLLVCKFREAT
jgi:hypothetical protein